MRIPKCASTSFIELFIKLSKSLNFHLEFNPSGAYNWKEEEMYSVSQLCANRVLLDKRAVYTRHFYFVDFTVYSLRSFKYVTVIRHPVDRVLSSYLYYHFSSRKHIQLNLNKAHKNESLSSCVQNQHEGCTHNLVTKYFCGHDNWCRLGDKRALDTAKKNLREHFAVVGIMEEMDLSLRLVRRVLPQFFVTNSFAGNGELTLSDLNKNEKTASLTERERQEIAETNAADMELYKYLAFGRGYMNTQSMCCTTGIVD